MSEIELLYKNAGIELQYLYTVEYMGNDGVSKLTGCNKETILNLFPEYNKRNYKVTKANKTDNFTPEKQLELIKWLCKNKGYTMLIKYINFMNSWRMECNFNGVVSEADFDECFAYLLNDRWQDLTESEQEQIRSILNG